MLAIEVGVSERRSYWCAKRGTPCWATRARPSRWGSDTDAKALRYAYEEDVDVTEERADQQVRAAATRLVATLR